jgi:hypothetical protein
MMDHVPSRMIRSIIQYMHRRQKKARREVKLSLYRSFLPSEPIILTPCLGTLWTVCGSALPYGGTDRRREESTIL